MQHRGGLAARNTGSRDCTEVQDTPGPFFYQFIQNEDSIEARDKDIAEYGVREATPDNLESGFQVELHIYLRPRFLMSTRF